METFIKVILLPTILFILLFWVKSCGDREQNKKLYHNEKMIKGVRNDK